MDLRSGMRYAKPFKNCDCYLNMYLNILYFLQLDECMLDYMLGVLDEAVDAGSHFSDDGQSYCDASTEIPRPVPCPHLHLFLCSLCYLSNRFSLFPISFKCFK